jgi:hypothetical protein
MKIFVNELSESMIDKIIVNKELTDDGFIKKIKMQRFVSSVVYFFQQHSKKILIFVLI